MERDDDPQQTIACGIPSPHSCRATGCVSPFSLPLTARNERPARPDCELRQSHARLEEYNLLLMRAPVRTGEGKRRERKGGGGWGGENRGGISVSSQACCDMGLLTPLRNHQLEDPRNPIGHNPDAATLLHLSLDRLARRVAGPEHGKVTQKGRVGDNRSRGADEARRGLERVDRRDREKVGKGENAMRTARTDEGRALSSPNPGVPPPADAVLWGDYRLGLRVAITVAAVLSP